MLSALLFADGLRFSAVCWAVPFNELVSSWLPALTDVHARLEAGDALRIADIGCGEGWAAIYLAEAYPNVRVDGFDLDGSTSLGLSIVRTLVESELDGQLEMGAGPSGGGTRVMLDIPVLG